MPPPDGMTQTEWEAYAREAVLAWRDIPFRASRPSKDKLAPAAALADGEIPSGKPC
jgi:hypothetical protein